MTTIPSTNAHLTPKTIIDRMIVINVTMACESVLPPSTKIIYLKNFRHITTSGK